DRLEILFRIVGEVRIERRRGGVRAHVADDNGGAVGRGARSAQRADRAAGANDILDHELLAEATGIDVGDDAAGDVGGAAGGEGDNHGDGTGRVVLRQRARSGE